MKPLGVVPVDVTVQIMQNYTLGFRVEGIENRDSGLSTMNIDIGYGYGTRHNIC